MDPFADLHVHAALPVLGRWWGRLAQGFSLPVLAGGDPSVKGPARLHVVSLYHTYLWSPGAARARLFRVLERLAGLAPGPGAVFPRTAADLADGNRERYLLAVESLRYLRDPRDLERLWSLGARSLQPIHFLDTAWGHSSLEGALPPSSRGLTGLGREMLAEMGRLGFILDLAHMNVPTAEESLLRYGGPVMCSHTGLREARPSGRNLPAALAREVFRRGGAVGVTCWKRLLPAASPPVGSDARASWTSAFCDTVQALAELAPGARVAVGSDRGAPILAPAWLFSPGHLREVEAALAERGWDETRRRALLAGNALAFLREALPAGPALMSRAPGPAGA